MLPCMWLNDDVIFDFRVLYKHLYVTIYLAYICDHFLFMLTFLSIHSSIHIQPSSHKQSLAGAGDTTVQSQPSASTTGHKCKKKPTKTNKKKPQPQLKVIGLVTASIRGKKITGDGTQEASLPQPVPRSPATCLSEKTLGFESCQPFRD